MTTAAPNPPTPTVKTTRVVRVADVSALSYLETEAEVDTFIQALKAELLAVVRAGEKARLN